MKRRGSFKDSVLFVGAFFSGGSYSPPKVNENEPPTHPPDRVSADAAELLIEEGRRQIDAQAHRFSNVQARAQQLLTIGLAEIGFLAVSVTSAQGWLPVVLIASGLGLALVGAVIAAAVSVVSSSFAAIDTTQLAQSVHEDHFLQRVALEYASAVIIGEDTVASRLTLFRRASRLAIWGASFGALGVVFGL